MQYNIPPLFQDKIIFIFSLEMMLQPWAAYRSCIAVTKNHNLKHCKESNNNKIVINKIKPLRDTNKDVAKA